MEGGKENSGEGEADDVGERLYKDQDLLWGTCVEGERHCPGRGEQATGRELGEECSQEAQGEGPLHAEKLGESRG